MGEYAVGAVMWTAVCLWIVAAWFFNTIRWR